MGNEKIIMPLTAEIMEEADEETSRRMKYVREHQKELKKMSEEEFFKAMMNAGK